MAIELALLPGRLHLKENGFTVDEEAELYEAQLQDILEHTREYLDNIEFMTPYYVSWKNYSFRTPTIPHKYTKDEKEAAEKA